ncbi:MAG TPA: hypothetical protein VKR55_31405 [Bradyrhizobium sp.]|uniref:hypothetical protein n=1 Tax=Bradyrhizobium sp. TaxID=376 RepID=UPI002BEF2B9A|nr:hypothetical protein [Bradyrhizobium sp.]HLZ06639.1 hypothetical protein [Bradyrhizobium sp.]
MIEQNRNHERDDVLFAFHQTCDNPTAEQVSEWTRRYPQYADDIREHAALRAQWASEPDESGAEPDESMLARGRSHALNLLHNARQEAAVQNVSEKTWPQAVSAAGFDIPRLARCINIDRMVLAELNAGRMRLPLGRRLANALSDVLGMSVAWLERAVSDLLAGPRRLGHAKADEAPTINTRSYAEVIQASSMSEDEKRYWLGEG